VCLIIAICIPAFPVGGGLPLESLAPSRGGLSISYEGDRRVIRFLPPAVTMDLDLNLQLENYCRSRADRNFTLDLGVYSNPLRLLVYGIL
jgi:hypothetical protein